VLRVVLSEVRNRRGRALALLLGILVATTSFTVLTGESQSQRLDVRGTVARSFRGDYDILVRPRGARDPLERRTQALRPNFLSDTFGGISTAQWRRIQRLPGVQVAAPLANVGYLLPTMWLPVRLDRAAIGHGRQLLRARVRWRSEDGLTQVADPGAQYAYVTPHRLLGEPFRGPGGIYRRESMREVVPGRAQPLAVCNSSWDANPAPSVIDGPFTAIDRSKFGCYSRASHTGRFWPDPRERGRTPVIEVPWVFPLLLTAVDPRTEAQLTGLNRTLTAGRYLRGTDRAHLVRVNHGADQYSQRVLPVLAASRTYEDERAELAIERLPPTSVDRWIRPFHFVAASGDFFAPIRFLIRQPDGPVVQRATISARGAYRVLLRALTGAPYAAPDTAAVWRTAPIGFRSQRGSLHPVVQPTAIDSWKDGTISDGLQWSYVSPSARDRAFRQVRSYHAHVYPLTPPRGFDPAVSAVGTFDPDRMGGAPEAGAPGLRTIQPSLLTARDAAATRRLHGRPLRANGHLGGYLAQPPALITSLRAAQAFSGDLFPEFSARRPISAVRVRVAGVTGIDALSRERIRQAASRIATATGLDVDIMAGASGAPTAIDLPAGRYGRPALALSETWVRKGVATRILSATDRKSLVLFALILVVCALFVANAASAAVRARRTELGILSSLGWSAGRLFGVVLLEVGGIGLCAGLLGSLLALPLAALVGVSASLPRAALAVAAATVLALLAGLAPAARAARSSPVAAVRPIVLETRRAWRPRGLGQLAMVNLIRTPGRTLLGSLSLAIGVCALTLLLAATVAFHDVLVGTLLGDAVSVQVRGSDYVAVASTVVLGLAAVADVLFLNLRERASEFATLSATGWDDRALGRLVALEGAWLGALGAFAGAAIGLVAAAAFAGALPAGLVLTALGAATAGTALASLTGLLSALWLRHAPLAPLLAGE
jgi:putative ABC transport system permease protein